MTTLRSRWASGDATLGAWLSIPSTVSAEATARTGFDYVCIDTQHGAIGYADTIAMVQAIGFGGSRPVVRVPWNEPGIIMKLLDAGAYGIICPMINSRAECEALVGAIRYAPKGFRSFGPTRAIWYAGSDYATKANDNLLAIAMIETRKAMDNLDEIMSTPGLDGIYVGPSDLALSLGGVPKLDQTDPPIVDAIRRIVECARRHGVHAGIHCGTTAYAKQAIEWGFQLVTIAADNALLAQAARGAVNDMKGSGTRQGAAGPY